MLHPKLKPNLPNQDIYEYILSNLGIKTPDNIFYREFDPDRLELMLTEGTDREIGSEIDKYHGELRIVKSLGLCPFLHAKEFTWVHKLGERINATPLGKIAIAIYDGSQLELFYESTLPSGAPFHTRGFAKFTNPDNQYNALLAVFKRES